MNISKSGLTAACFSIIFVALCMLNIFCYQDESSHADKIDELLSAYSEYGKFNGSVLVATGGEIIYKKGFGLANMEWNIPNRADTKHRIASISKQFTAMLIVQLAAEEKLDLHLPISNYLPDYPEQAGSQITIHHLLTHSSGIPDYGAFSNYRALERNRYRPADILELFNELPLEFNPGEHYNYSNSGYIILGLIIEKITGQPYARVLEERIFTPLSMHNTGYDDQRSILKNRAAGYAKRWETYYNANFFDMSLVYSAGGMYSTVEDLYTWDQALYTNKLLPEKYMQQLFDTHMPTGRRHYAYGWFVDEIPQGKSNQRSRTINHGGGMDGFRTQITRIPSSKSLIVLLNNTEHVPLYEITVAINGILHDQPYEMPDKSIALSMKKMIEGEGITQGLQYYAHVKNTKGYYLDENEMIHVGYSLLHNGKGEEAASIFKLCIDAFPNSYNVYDSYAESQKVLGNKDEAIEYYKKSIEINPGNQNGLNMLAELGVNTSELIWKVSPGHLRRLSGDYIEVDHTGSKLEKKKIKISAVDGVLIVYDMPNQYQLLPIDDHKYVNQRYGVTIVFDTAVKKNQGFVMNGNKEFKKSIP